MHPIKKRLRVFVGALALVCVVVAVWAATALSAGGGSTSTDSTAPTTTPAASVATPTPEDCPEAWGRLRAPEFELELDELLGGLPDPPGTEVPGAVSAHRAGPSLGAPQQPGQEARALRLRRAPVVVGRQRPARMGRGDALGVRVPRRLDVALGRDQRRARSSRAAAGRRTGSGSVAGFALCARRIAHQSGFGVDLLIALRLLIDEV